MKHAFRSPFNPWAHTSLGRSTAAAAEIVERATRRYEKPSFGIRSVRSHGRYAAVREEVVWQRPFCRLLRFRRDLSEREIERCPRLLIVAPLSGHYATLLRGTVEALLPDHEVYITDWIDARQVPVSQGNFGLGDYVDYLVEMIGLFGGDVHLMAVCQPCVPALMAIARLEQQDDGRIPYSMMLFGGPVDTRHNPTAVNRFALEKGIDWFSRNMLSKVPWPYPGERRHVYPGFLQLSGFMSMNMSRHLGAHRDLYFNLVKGDGNSASRHRAFYDEYLAVMDLSAEFYIQTVQDVFIEHALPRGQMLYRGSPVDLGAIRRVALLTVEGEKDDITGVGQCHAAHELCRSIPPTMRAHHLQPSVGHYGIFNGRRFREDIVPAISGFIRHHDKRGRSRLIRVLKRIQTWRPVAFKPRLHGKMIGWPDGPQQFSLNFDSC